MKLDLSKVELSRNDVRLAVSIPKVLDKNLAYFMGIHTGDGSMGFYRKYDYKLDYSGHLIDEYKFYTRDFKVLFYNLFNKELRVYKRYGKGREWIQLCTQSKGISTFLNKSLDLPFGPKKEMHIPQLIIDSKFKKYFIRGLADSDFSLVFKKRDKELHYYPVINWSSSSKLLVTQINSLLVKFGFQTFQMLDFPSKRYEKTHISHRLDINGENQINLWMEKIGFNSRKHITKYLVWKKFGFCPPYTNLPQREAILKGKLNPYSFYKSPPKSL